MSEAYLGAPGLGYGKLHAKMGMVARLSAPRPAISAREQAGQETCPTKH